MILEPFVFPTTAGDYSQTPNLRLVTLIAVETNGILLVNTAIIRDDQTGDTNFVKPILKTDSKRTNER